MGHVALYREIICNDEKKRRSCRSGCIGAFFSVASSAVASVADAEIQYLLKTMGESGCTFVRNWSEHPAAEARSHMEMKYGYAKDKITRAEQFIKYITTKSSITGKEYVIRCGDSDYPSAQWLTQKLEAYRNSGSTQ